uniref:Uncharacterized protein n=1 Tax=Populus davidiana TaxID=266767 RepID=A0A6M2EDW7_9ROSI
MTASSSSSFFKNPRTTPQHHNPHHLQRAKPEPLFLLVPPIIVSQRLSQEPVAHPLRPLPPSHLQPTEPAWNHHQLTHGETTTNSDLTRSLLTRSSQEDPPVNTHKTTIDPLKKRKL